MFAGLRSEHQKAEDQYEQGKEDEHEKNHLR
jgi:hypothetical protein